MDAAGAESAAGAGVAARLKGAAVDVAGPAVGAGTCVTAAALIAAELAAAVAMLGNMKPPEPTSDILVLSQYNIWEAGEGVMANLLS